MSTQRMERDAFGEIPVDADRLWGAATQRSLQFFAIGADRMPLEVVRCEALTMVCAQVMGNDVAVSIGQFRAERLQAADHSQRVAQHAIAGGRDA